MPFGRSLRTVDTYYLNSCYCRFSLVAFSVHRGSFDAGWWKVLGVEGEEDGDAPTARFPWLSAIAVDDVDNVIVADHNLIRFITLDGERERDFFLFPFFDGVPFFLWLYRCCCFLFSCCLTALSCFVVAFKGYTHTIAGCSLSFSGVAGGGFADGYGSSAQFRHIRGLSISPLTGALCCCDSYKQCIRQICLE